MATDTRDRILNYSAGHFNEHGVEGTSTNHLARGLAMSPGNLYFHFRNKEEIVRDLFARMTADLQRLWTTEGAARSEEDSDPVSFIERTFELFWQYRFFHREMYALRRRDPQLARLWRAHVRWALATMETLCLDWSRRGMLRRFTAPEDGRFLAAAIVVQASAFLQFFEGGERKASRAPVRRGIVHVHRVLWPYYAGTYRRVVKDYISG